MELLTKFVDMFAGLSPWVQAVAIGTFGLTAFGTIHCLTTMFRRRPVEIVHYVAKEDKPVLR